MLLLMLALSLSGLTPTARPSRWRRMLWRRMSLMMMLRKPLASGQSALLLRPRVDGLRPLVDVVALHLRTVSTLVSRLLRLRAGCHLCDPTRLLVLRQASARCSTLIDVSPLSVRTVRVLRDTLSLLLRPPPLPPARRHHRSTLRWSTESLRCRVSAVPCPPMTSPCVVNTSV